MDYHLCNIVKGEDEAEVYVPAVLASPGKFVEYNESGMWKVVNVQHSTKLTGEQLEQLVEAGYQVHPMVKL